MATVPGALRHRVKGFSLVELMVAMVIGLFGVLLMMQLFSLSEKNKRATTSGNDAMNEGVISLYAVQRDIRMAGFGIADLKILGCNVLLRSGVTLAAIAPVTINHASIPAGDAYTDTLLVVYANTNGSPQGDTANAAGTGVMTPLSFANNDYVIAAPASRTDSSVYSAACLPSLTLDQVVVVQPSVTLLSGTALGVGTTLFNLGAQRPSVMVYAVRNGNLTVCNYNTNDCGAAISVDTTANWVPIGNNIVSLRAQYGRDTSTVGAMDGVVDVYDQVLPNTACELVRVSAVRLALVARSAQPAAAVTSIAPTWEGTVADNPVGSTADPINLSGNPAWQNYRYKVFQTTIPIRNISWIGKVSGC